LGQVPIIRAALRKQREVGAADPQPQSQKLLYRRQVLMAVVVKVKVNAGFAGRFRDRGPASPDFVIVNRLRRIS
jgi:hypothetical protein